MSADRGVQDAIEMYVAGHSWGDAGLVRVALLRRVAAAVADEPAAYAVTRAAGVIRGLIHDLEAERASDGNEDRAVLDADAMLRAVGAGRR